MFTRGGNDTELPSVIHPGDEDLLRYVAELRQRGERDMGLRPGEGPRGKILKLWVFRPKAFDAGYARYSPNCCVYCMPELSTKLMVAQQRVYGVAQSGG